jgi:hypothetical protein
MTLHYAKETDTRVLPILAGKSQPTPGDEKALTSQETIPMDQLPELFSRRIEAKQLVVSHLVCFLQAADAYLQVYGTMHNFGRELSRCLETLQATRAKLQVR